MFNKETEYALRGLIYIQIQNNKGRNPGVIEIAQEIKAPQSFVGKVLQRLVKKEIVSSKKGKGGGFYFEDSQSTRTLKNVISLLEGDKLLISCGVGLDNCSFETPCPLHTHFVKIRQAMDDLFTSLDIRTLAIQPNTYLKL
jgi:Rrf2 family protein